MQGYCRVHGLAKRFRGLSALHRHRRPGYFGPKRIFHLSMDVLTAPASTPAFMPWIGEASWNSNTLPREGRHIGTGRLNGVIPVRGGFPHDIRSASAWHGGDGFMVSAPP